MLTDRPSATFPPLEKGGQGDFSSHRSTTAVKSPSRPPFAKGEAQEH